MTGHETRRMARLYRRVASSRPQPWNDHEWRIGSTVAKALAQELTQMRVWLDDTTTAEEIERGLRRGDTTYYCKPLRVCDELRPGLILLVPRQK